MKRSDRIIKKIVSWAVAALYHRVEVRQAPGLTETGPQLANASHFGGFTDPLLLIYTMDRVPRFVARDVIWRFIGAKQVMNWVGAIPIHKPEDGGRSSNDTMFASTYDALHDDQLVTIFPEGITVDDPSIAHIKTGSARIALGARAAGVQGIKLLSAGIHYENKAALRSEVFIDIGWEMDLDEEVRKRVEPGDAEDASNRELVRGLTDEMEVRLRKAAPDFADWQTARSLSSAANVALRGFGKDEREVGHGDRERLATLLDEATSEEMIAVTDAMEVYQADLDAMGFTDEMLMSGLNTASRFIAYIVRTFIIGLILVPFALMGVIAFAIPMAIVWLIGRLKVDDAVMATIKPLGALFVFLVAWGFWMWRGWGAGDFQGIAAVLLLLPVGLYAVIAFAERGILLAHAIRGFRRSRSLSDVYGQILVHRQAVVEAVASAA
ncbi:MAG: 1-acyl-sn-glycerol-3-phosphate acyltransferase [Actinomycetia bacterium]|nr:1-acyl-sn-glycerol-3-phosphate acyltransferase [Actinomycetes bacterium]